MSDNDKLQKSDLFMELSDQEQEKASGGINFYVQKQTSINSFANGENNLSGGGNRTLSSKQNAGYNYSQTVTLGFDLNAMLGEDTLSRTRKYGISPLDLIYKLLLYIFTS